LQKRELKIFFDGGCRPNPGMMQAVVVIRGTVYHSPNIGYGDNNDAEWLAIIYAAELALKHGHRDVILIGDATVIVNQANGKVKCRGDNLRGHLANFLTLQSQFDRMRIRYVNRSQNLAGIVLDKIFNP
jgi:ribonuclease HI